ncbi:MAG: NUDIX hydrolase [Actinomycetes bacterium]
MAAVASDPAPIEAAGGVVLRTAADGACQVLVVYRRRYQDWSLPKGKLEQGERAEDAAVREVLEETGVHCELGARLPDVRYEHRGRPKRVRWWAMTVLTDRGHTPDDEVQQVRWVDVDAAGELLTYADDERTLRSALARG